MAHESPAVNPPLRRREVWAWCGYDFANSAFPTLIVTVAYSVYFKNVVVPETLRASGDLLWGLSLSTSMVLVVLSTPVLGALADRAAHKRRYLLFYTLLCVAATAALAGVGPGEVAAGIGLFLVANVGFESALVFYNAFLPSVAPPAYRGRVSGWGYGVGYVGGLLCLVLALPLLGGGFGAENLPAFRASFPLVAAFYLVFSLPTFLWVPEREGRREAGTSLLRAAEEVLRTLRSLGRDRELLRFLAAFFLYSNAVITVIAFSSLYAVNTLGFSMQEVLYLFISIQLAAGVGAWALGHVGDRLGLRRTLEGTLWNWCFVVVLAYVSPNKETFWVAGLLAGLSLGSTQSLSRPLMATFAPPGREAESFSYYGICGKVSSILGPTVFGLTSTLTGSQRTAILSVLFFFGAGLLLLRGVGERGRETEAS
ncbi:MAG: MFS transporter [Nitrospinota bacterium]